MSVHPTLGWMLAALFGALAAGSLSRLISLRGKPPDLVRNRVDSLKTWWLIAPTFAIAVVLGQTAVAVVFVLIGWLALSEYARLIWIRTDTGLPAAGDAGSTNSDMWLLRLSLILVPLHFALICLQWTLPAHLFLPVGGLILLSISQTAAGRIEGFTRAVACSYWGLLLLVYGPSHAVMLWSLPADRCADIGPVGWFMFLLVLTEMNDIAQAFFGRHWGERRIAPIVSPFKTWVGFSGGVCTTTLLAIVLAPVLTDFGDAHLAKSVAAGLLIAVVGFFGDINLSAVKRDAGVKDSGTLLPGQGGVLDRVDSLTFTAPAFYAFVLWATA
ncbi:MAG: phosphatidate cytidylyltransferase [Planctomycetota bacterium]|jgi:phosphatidate cytidylyltransferase